MYTHWQEGSVGPPFIHTTTTDILPQDRKWDKTAFNGMARFWHSSQKAENDPPKEQSQSWLDVKIKMLPSEEQNPGPSFSHDQNVELL